MCEAVERIAARCEARGETRPVLGLCKADASNCVNKWKSVYGCIPKDEADTVRNAIAEQHSIDEEMWR